MKPREIITNLFDGELILRKLVERHLRFIFFLFGLVIVYISLHYAVSQTLVEGRKLERELKNLRAEYTSCKAALMFLSKREEISKHLADLGSKVHAPTLPPRRIMMEEYPHE